MTETNPKAETESSSAQQPQDTTSTTVSSSSSSTSALRENIENKGKNSYYFAHKNTPTGPKWDGKAAPRLLSTTSITHSNSNSNSDSDPLSASASALSSDNFNSSLHMHTTKSNSKSSFDIVKSNITKYAFLDDGKKVKLYIDLKGIGDAEGCDVTLDWAERSFSLVIKNYQEPNTNPISQGDNADADVITECQDKCLSFGKLHGSIQKATYKRKTDKIIVILTKKVQERTSTDAEVNAEVDAEIEVDAEVKAEVKAEVDAEVDAEVESEVDAEVKAEVESEDWPCIACKGESD